MVGGAEGVPIRLIFGPYKTFTTLKNNKSFSFEYSCMYFDFPETLSKKIFLVYVLRYLSSFTKYNYILELEAT